VKIEVLYVAECPSHPEAVKLLRGILAAEGIAADIHEVLVRDERMANELRFLGSPTIRINGRDVAGESQGPQSFALSCRLYPGSKHIGLLSAEMIRHAVVDARKEEDRETGNRRVGVGERDSEFRGNHPLLSTPRIRRGSGSRCCECLLRDPASTKSSKWKLPGPLIKIFSGG